MISNMNYKNWVISNEDDVFLAYKEGVDFSHLLNYINDATSNADCFSNKIYR